MSKYILFTAVLGCALTTSCQQNQSITPQEKQPFCLSEQMQSSIELYTATTQNVVEQITLNATVEYDKEHTLEYISMHDGIINQVNFSLGEYVKKGQVLALIQSSSIAELQSQLNSSTTELNLALKELEATQQMFNDGLASRIELLTAQNAVEVLQNTVKIDQANFKSFKGTASNGVYQITAPISGYILAKDIVVNSTVVATETPLFTIAALDKVWIMANVYATQKKYISANLPVQVSTLAYPEDIFHGKISYITKAFDPEQRVLKARIELENTDFKLSPGMACDVVVDLDKSNTKAIAVPNDAVIFDNNQNFVVVFNSKCEVEVRKIDVLSSNQTYTYIVDGLKENERVVTTNELLIYEQLINQL